MFTIGIVYLCLQKFYLAKSLPLTTIALAIFAIAVVVPFWPIASPAAFYLMFRNSKGA